MSWRCSYLAHSRFSLPVCSSAWAAFLLFANAWNCAATVPQSVSFTFDGVVKIDRGDILSLEASCKNQIITWMCPHGMKVAKGDPIIIFDTTVPQKRLELVRYNERLAEAEMDVDSHRLHTGLDELQEEKAALEAELAVVQAGLRKARSVDSGIVDLLEAQYEEMRDSTRNLRREGDREKALVDLGQISVEELVASRIALGKSESNAELARLKWKRHTDRIDEIDVARLEVTERELMLKLGQSEVRGSSQGEATKHGIAKRIEAMERQFESELKYSQSELDRMRNEAREALRDSFDYTPLNFIEILEAGSGEAIRRIAFGPAGDEASPKLPAGFVLDDGSAFDSERGYGWDKDQREHMKLRDASEPLQRGVALMKGRSTWRCSIKPGTYRLRIGVGDEGDWHGPLIRHADRALLSKIRIDSWEVVEETIRVEGSELVLTIGDEQVKVMRATGDGVANCRERLFIGERVRRSNWPVAYFSPNDRLTIECIVHQDYIGLLKAMPIEAKADNNASNLLPTQVGQPSATSEAIASPPSTRALRIAQARHELATSDVAAVTVDGVEIPCSVQEIDNIPVEIKRGAEVWWAGEEKKGKDLVARQVFLTPRTNVTEHLQQGEAVRCVARIIPRDGMTAVPAHLVVEGEAEAHVLEAHTGRELDVEGFRVGRWFLVTAGIDSDTGLTVPARPDVEDSSDRRFAGEVVAGKKIEVGLADYWGRIKDLVPDGSNVDEGELIITLRNPSLEESRHEIKTAKAKAQEQYLVAMETRRVKTVEARLKHDDKVLAERRARLEIRDLDEHNPIKAAKAKAAAEQASLELREAEGQQERYAALETASKSYVESARIAAGKAACNATKARLDLVVALRQANRLEVSEARRGWLDAVDALSERAEALTILRLEESVSRMSAEAGLHRALEGQWREIAFERNKHIRAPVSGRLFYLTGWDDHANARTKYKKDFPVWGGDAIAQILDMSELGMEAQLPEKMYQQINSDSKVVVGFDPAPGVEIEARIETIGDSFVIPDDYSVNDQAGKSATSLRVFGVKVLFSPPGELADHLVPGTKGYVWFP